MTDATDRADVGPAANGDFAADADKFGRFWRAGAARLAVLPKKPRRNPAEQAAAERLLAAARAARARFLGFHAERVYRTLTRDGADFLRLEPLCDKAASLVPGLVPTPAEIAGDSDMPQRDKDGIEIDQGIFLSHILAHPWAGAQLCHAMLRPLPEAAALAEQFAADGRLDLGPVTLERAGNAVMLTMRNPRFLNAEDETTLAAFELAADIAILDRGSEIAVLRGDVVEHAKYRGRRVFSAGINLTHLYYGKIPFLWYLTRDMGVVNKLYRGVATDTASPDEVDGGTVEKPWIAAVDTFAIGGGCQILLVMDYVLAASDAYLTLPARKEGIIPGAANLRLARFTGGRIAREAILYGRRLDCDSAEGRLVCDEIAAPDAMDQALARIIDGFTSAGVVSAAGNRRALRMGEEPFDLFRRYMAVYAREQAACHFSPALIANLELHWNAQQRRA